MKDRIRNVAPWLLGLVVLFAAFGIGRCTASPETPETAAHEHSYTCSMHPQILQPEPGSCPLCGMDLVPVGSVGDDLAEDQVALSPRARALAGVRTVEVAHGETDGATLTLSGRVEVDETSERTVTAWVGGRIDRLHVRVTGQAIRRGQTIATLYSPEVYAAQRDLRTASRQLERLAGGTELARSAAGSTLEAARERLRLLGVPDAEIERMRTRESPSQRIAIRSPFAGTVLERVATEGSYVTPGAPLYRVADLSRLWVQLDAYERDLGRLRVGQTVEVRVEGVPGTREGRVAFVDPVVDARRRTARVRVEIEDADGLVRPGMFAEARVRGASEAQLTVPASAPLFTGRRSIVYVELPDAARPTYEARVVRLGPRSGDGYPVLEGLEAGERVVLEGAFAIDADLQIRGGPSMMARDPAPDVSLAAFAAPLAAYLELQRALAETDLDASRAAAARIVTSAAGEPALAERLEPASRVAEASDIAAARVAFEPLSGAVVRLLRALGNPTDTELRLAHCPMAFENRGAAWVQRGDTIDNAYFGDAMRTCGSFRQTFPATEASDE